MKITKLGHACLLVEMPAPVNRTALFDPGSMSTVDVDSLQFLDDIFITHEHGDHKDIPLIKRLVAKFPEVRITSTDEVVKQLAEEGIKAGTTPPEGVVFFDSPHEGVTPLFNPPEEIGFHYLGKLSHPGDSHSFKETKTILALPVQAPWGSTATAVNLALQLKPQHVLPIHDWHWRDEAREQMYNRFEQVFADNGITFHKLKNGEPIVIDT